MWGMASTDSEADPDVSGWAASHTFQTQVGVHWSVHKHVCRGVTGS